MTDGEKTEIVLFYLKKRIKNIETVLINREGKERELVEIHLSALKRELRIVERMVR